MIRQLLKGACPRYSQFLRARRIAATTKPQIIHNQIYVDELAHLKTDPRAVAEIVATEQRAMRNLEAKLDQELLRSAMEKTKGRTNASIEDIPELIGDYYYFTRYDFVEGKEYPLVYRYKDLKKDAVKVLDPVKDGIIRRQYFSSFVIKKLVLSDDQRYLGIVVDLVNKESGRAFYKDLETGKVGLDFVNNCYNFAFSKCNKYMYYVRLDDKTRPYAIYRHTVGQRGSLLDELVYEERDERYFVDIDVLKAKDYFVAYCSGKGRNKVNLMKRTGAINEPFVQITADSEGVKSVQQNSRGLFAVMDGEERTQLVFCEGRSFEREFDDLKRRGAKSGSAIFKSSFTHQTVYALSADETLTECDVFEDNVVLYTVSSGRNKVINIKLKEQAGAVSFEPVEVGFRDSQTGVLSPLTNMNLSPGKFYFSFDNPFVYNETYECSLATDATRLLKAAKFNGIGFNGHEYTITDLEFASTDAAKVPLVLVHNRNEDIRNPKALSKVLVKLYGCYGMPTNLGFSTSDWNYLENNWMIAIPLIRGGGDKGPNWHKAATTVNKHRSIEDILSCMRFLIAKGLSHSSLLAATSNSAGAGLLAAAINAEPHLLKGAVLDAPFVDFLALLHDKTLPLSQSDYEEFGNPERVDEFNALFGLCPYSNVRKAAYPAMMINTYTDDYRTPLWSVVKYFSKLKKTISRPEGVADLGNNNVFLNVLKGSHASMDSSSDDTVQSVKEFVFLETVMKKSVDTEVVKRKLKLSIM